MNSEQKAEKVFPDLKRDLKGELYWDETLRKLYATDASAYREMPMGVAFPAHSNDIQRLIQDAVQHDYPLIPRAAGTSLAGQVVGHGLVVDVSRFMTDILEVNQNEGWVRLEPGVIRDELNAYLQPMGLFFGPETSTSNRCMIGGMIGNNSCGARSLVYGSTREHLLELKGYLPDGSFIHAKALTTEEYQSKLNLENLEGDLYRWIDKTLRNPEFRETMLKEFPHPDIPRRNTGYALDLLAHTQPFGGKEPFNLCTLLAGSEGTLVFTTQAKMKLVPLPPPEKGLACLHFKDVDSALRGNILALDFNPLACELMDHYILDCTKEHPIYSQYRGFVQGDPGAILVVELAEADEAALMAKAEALNAKLLHENLAYAAPLIRGEEMAQVWELRKAGLGLLSNIPGDEKPVAVIEDTAVRTDDLPDFIAEFNLRLKKRGLYCVHYAHAATGELHLRPILNLKTNEGVRDFRAVAEDIADLVKKYRGSLSGEHGDGRLRAEFIPQMLGETIHKSFEDLKHVVDPYRLFNPGKIVEAPAMDTSLRYTPGQETREVETALDFSKWKGFVRSAEMCNGSGDCRKTEISGGTMCPSYMVTREEKHTTRARANMIRELFSDTDLPNSAAFEHDSLEEVMDLCLSCKGCKSECPSNVDVAKLKAEVNHQKIQSRGASFRQKQFAHFTQNFKKGKVAPEFFNWIAEMKITKKILGVHPERSMPKLARTSFHAWWKENQKNFPGKGKGKLVLFMDEFTNLLEPEIGKAAVKVLTHLGYEIEVPVAKESGRSQISKGFLNEAKNIAQAQVKAFLPYHEAGVPIIGLEPSAVLGFRDEYPDLLRGKEQEEAKALSKSVFLFEEFLDGEIEKGKLKKGELNSCSSPIRIHGHCHQKALSSMKSAKAIYHLVDAKDVRLIPSGCCGMAGSFGFEEEHFKPSMQIGGLVLFPSINQTDSNTILVAAGTSCRHQILDGTKRIALHPAEALEHFIP